MNRIALISLLAVLWGQVAPSGASQDATHVQLSFVALELVADELVDPVNVRQPPDNSGRLYIGEKMGRIRIFDSGILLDEPFLNIVSTTISASAEQSLYDIAFNPQFATNELFEVSGGGTDLEGNVYVTTCTCTSTFGITPVTGQERKTGAVWRLVPADGGASATQRPTPIAAIPSLVEETRTTIVADWLFTSRYRRETT